MNWYKLAQRVLAYHGTNKSFNDFDISFSGEGYDQEGPGIYFTSDPKDASRYAIKGNMNEGARVFPVYLNFKNVVPTSGEANKEHIKKLLLMSIGLNSENQLNSVSEDIFYDSAFSDFGETPEEAFQEAFNAYTDYSEGSSESPHDTFMTIWHDFYKSDPIGYLNSMVRLGYDGVIVPKGDNLTHYIVFNKDIIEPYFNNN